MVHLYQVQSLLNENADWKGYDITVRRLIQHGHLQWGQVDGNLRMDARARRWQPSQQRNSQQLEVPRGSCVAFHIKGVCK
jgi:hypothetical protein